MLKVYNGWSADKPVWIRHNAHQLWQPNTPLWGTKTHHLHDWPNPGQSTGALTVTRARPASDFYSESQDCDGQTFTSPSFGPTTQRTVCFMAAMLLRRAAQVRLSKATTKKGYLLLIYSFSSERFCHLWKSPEEKGKRFFFYLPRNIQHIIINYIANTLRQSPFEFFLSLNCTVLIYCLQEFFIYLFFPPLQPMKKRHI